MKKNIITERFKSMDHLLDTLSERPLNKAFTNASISSQRTDRSDWYKTKTYEEAIEVVRVGYKDPLERMKKAIVKIGKTDNYIRPKMKNSVVGFVPNVPNHLNNIPETMLNRDPRKNKAKTIHLTYSFGASANVEADQLIQGGIMFISLVNSLEKQGYSVKIDIIFTTLTSKTATSIIVTVKEYGQRLNLLKLAFPLVHPSMLRRISFKFLETTPDLKDKDYNGGYGRPLTATMKDIELEREFLYDNKIIKKDTFYATVYQAFGAKDLKQLANEIGIN